MIFTALLPCEKCEKGFHILYYYHQRLVCNRCLPERAQKVLWDRVPVYTYTLIKP